MPGRTLPERKRDNDAPSAGTIQAIALAVDDADESKKGVHSHDHLTDFIDSAADCRAFYQLGQLDWGIRNRNRAERDVGLHARFAAPSTIGRTHRSGHVSQIRGSAAAAAGVSRAAFAASGSNGAGGHGDHQRGRAQSRAGQRGAVGRNRRTEHGSGLRRAVSRRRTRYRSVRGHGDGRRTAADELNRSRRTTNR